MATDQQPTIGEEASGYASPVLDLIAAACLVALAVWVMIEAARMEVPGALATAPGLLPFLAAASLAIMAIALGALALRRRAAAPAVAGLPRQPAEVRRAVVLFAIVGCYLLALETLSFDYAISIAGTRLAVGSFELVSTLVLTALLAMFWGRSLAVCALVAAGWIFALAAVFRYLFKLPLPG